MTKEEKMFRRHTYHLRLHRLDLREYGVGHTFGEPLLVSLSKEKGILNGGDGGRLAEGDGDSLDAMAVIVRAREGTKRATRLDLVCRHGGKR